MEGVGAVLTAREIGGEGGGGPGDGAMGEAEGEAKRQRFSKLPPAKKIICLKLSETIFCVFSQIMRVSCTRKWYFCFAECHGNRSVNQQEER